MILVDANLLLYAHINSFPQHKAAASWLDDQLNGATPVGLPWPSLLAFLRLVTNRRVFQRPETTASAWSQVQVWLSSAVAWIPQPSERHFEILQGLLQDYDIRGDSIPDAHLAALALEHGLTLFSADKDFSRFREIRWVNPLV